MIQPLENHFEQGGLKMSADEAVIEIGKLRDQAQVLGANDSELSTLNNLMESVREGGDIDKALSLAHRIYNSKQDYH